MTIPMVSGASIEPAQMNAVAAAPVSAQAQAPAAAAGVAPAASGSTTSIHTASSTSSLLFDPVSKPSNLALAYLILQMLLQGDDDKKSQTDPLLAGLAAGLLAAEQNRAPQFFFSSSRTETSTQITANPQQVSAAYNTEMPGVAANPTAATGQTNSQQVPKVDMQA